MGCTLLKTCKYVSRNVGHNRVKSALCPKGTNVVDEVSKFVDGIVHGKNKRYIKFIFCQQDTLFWVNITIIFITKVLIGVVI